MRSGVLILLFLLGCGSKPATVMIRAYGVPDGTISVNLDSAPYDSCNLLPRRYAPNLAVLGLVFERRCFLGEPSYTLDAWTYDKDCCIRSSGQATFAGEVDPMSRNIEGNLSVDVQLMPRATLDCRPGLQCGPQ